MITWTIWLQDNFDFSWSKAATWTADMIAKNGEGWQDAFNKACKTSYETRHEMRIQRVTVP